MFALRINWNRRGQLRQWIGDQAVDLLFNRSRAGPNTGRADAPVVHPYARHSLATVRRATTDSSILAQADADFQRDKFAASSQGPRDSRWKTWCAMAEQRGSPPLPVTADLVAKVGALLKLGRYRSAAQYFSVAKSFHREAGFEWEPHLDHAVNQAVRSITRVIGPSSAKLDVPLELCDSQFASRISEAYEALRVPEDHSIDFRDDTGLVASWFMLRGLEIATAVCEDVSFSREGVVKFLCRFPRTTLLVADATDLMSAYVFASMTQAVVAQVMKPSCLLPCSAVSVWLAVTPFASTTQLSAYQWVFGPKVAGMQQPRSLGTAQVRLPSLRSPGSPERSRGLSAHRTFAIGLRRSSSDGRSIHFEFLGRRCSPGLIWTCTSLCCWAGGGPPPLFAMSKRRQSPTLLVQLRPCRTGLHLPRDTVILLFSAPLCHDFSPIRKTPPGTSGTEGAKFSWFATWLKTFFCLCHLSKWLFSSRMCRCPPTCNQSWTTSCPHSPSSVMRPAGELDPVRVCGGPT